MPRPRTSSLTMDIEFAYRQLKELSPNLEELARRRRFAPSDGYPSSSMGGEGGGSEINRPTENAAMAPVVSDVAGDSIDESFDSLVRALALIGVAHSAAMYALSLGVNGREQQSTVRECRACNQTISGVGNDRVRGAGYCAGCYAAFARYRRNLPTTDLVDHAQFESARRAYLAEKAVKPDSVAS